MCHLRFSILAHVLTLLVKKKKERREASRSNATLCLLVVICQDCVNPVPQVVIHLLCPPPAFDGVSPVLLLLTE